MAETTEGEPGTTYSDEVTKMLVYFVRHGETTWNKRKKLQGQHDTKLTPRGLEQARLAGQGMKDIPFDYIISSPLSRARMTAEIIRGDRDLEIDFDDRLKEIDFGKDNGRCFGKILEDPRYVRYYRFFKDSVARNNIKVGWWRAKVGLKGSWRCKCPVIAYIGVCYPFVRACMPSFIRQLMYKVSDKINPRTN